MNVQEWTSWSDERWMQGVRGEDEETQQVLIRLIEQQINALLYRKVADFGHEQLADLRQSAVMHTWTKLTRKIDQFQGSGSFLAWSRAIANHEVQQLLRDIFKRKARQPEESLDLMLETKGEPEQLTQSQPLDDAESSDPARLAALRGCVDALDERSQAVVDQPQLYLDSEHNGSVARTFSITRNYLYQLRHRVLQRLRKCMKSKGFGST